MRILLLYQGEYPPAERIEKTANTLLAAGHGVALLCNDYGKHTAAYERCGGLEVFRVTPGLRSRTINRIVKFPLFLNPLWLAHIVRVIRRFRPDAIQVIDLPLAPAAWAIGRLLGMPVVMDMWENYPEALKGWAKLDWKVRVFKNPAVARAVERFITPRMDHIFVVVDEQRDRLIDEGVRADRISVVTNATDVDSFTANVARLPTPLDGSPATYKMLYVGFITVERGLDDIIRALARLKEPLPITLYIAGTGNYQAPLRDLARAEGVEDRVRFTGWVPFEQIRFYLEESDLCIIPHTASKFIDTTIPNKLFQYMLMGKPLLVSNAKPLARIVNECNCGFVFNSGDPDSAAAAIHDAWTHRRDHSFGERGKVCVLNKYTWEKVGAGLADYYGSLERQLTLPDNAPAASFESPSGPAV